MPALDAVTIMVADMDRTLRFYRLLGLETPQVAPGEVNATARQPVGVRVDWTADATEHHTASPDPPPVNPRIAIAVRCADAAEVDATHRAIVDAGYESSREPWDAPWGSRHSCVLDPSGNPIELFAPLP